MNQEDVKLTKKNARKYRLEMRKQYVERWKTSNLTRSEFCRREGLVLQTFCYWLTKYHSREAMDRAENQLSQATIPFVSLSTKKKALPEPSKPQIEMILPSGLSCVLKCCDDISWVVKLIEGLNHGISHQK